MKRLYLISISLILFPFGQAFSQDKQPQIFNLVEIEGVRVFGKSVDHQTRCVHWHSQLDVIAIKFKCCGKYYPCFSCHEEEAGHDHHVWLQSEFDQKAILCGVCGHELSIQEYMEANNTCPKCEASFNPGCSKHYHLYFETDESKAKITPQD